MERKFRRDILKIVDRESEVEERRALRFFMNTESIRGSEDRSDKRGSDEVTC